MLKERVKQKIQSGVEKSFGLLTRPFAEADTLESYSDRGYVLLGIILSGLTFVCWWWNLFNTPLNRSDSLIYALFEWAVQSTGGPKSIPERYATTLFLPIIAYILVGMFLRGARRWTGEQFANCCFWLLNKAIAAGEWFIEHRWWSLLFIIFLTSLLAYFFHVYTENQRIANEKQRLDDSFARWLDVTQDFLVHDTFSKVASSKYARVKPLWLPDFETHLRPRNRPAHPGTCLNAIMENLYGEDKNGGEAKALPDKLTASNINALKALADECPPRPPGEMDELEARTHALINSLIGRASLRHFDAEDKQSRDYELLREASRRFELILEISRRFDNVEPGRGANDKDDENDKIGRKFKSDAMNGKGWIYTTALDVYLDPLMFKSLSDKQRNSLADICDGVKDCLERAYDRYREAGKEYGGCTYEHKREVNNVLDLFLRVGTIPNDEIPKIENPQISALLRSPAALTDKIESWVKELMGCNSTGIEPAHVFTVSQAYAVRVLLRRRAQQGAAKPGPNGPAPAAGGTPTTPAEGAPPDDRNVAKMIEHDLFSSGYYLRLYNSFEKSEALKYVKTNNFFCPVVSGGTVHSVFRDAMETPRAATPSAAPLLTEIQNRCQSEK